MSRATSETNQIAASPLAHVPALDGLRGAAVVAVVLFHAGHLQGGFLGVDLFFVLSGFLITRILVAEHQHTGHIRLGRFYGRRLRRLAPAVLVLVGTVVLVAPAVFREETATDLRAAGLATIANVANWRSIWSGDDYWAALRGPGPFEHTWSLSIEEQVYLIWPLTLVLALRFKGRRDSRAVAALVAVAGIVLSLASLGYLLSTGASAARLYYGTDTRIFAVLVGAFVGTVSLSEQGKRVLQRPAVQQAGVVSAVLIGASWFAVVGDSPYLHRGLLLSSGILSGLVVGVVSTASTGPLSAVLGISPLRALGVLSYSLYLWHWPVFVALNPQSTGRSGWSLTMIRLGMSLLFAIVSYLVVERPFRITLPKRFAATGIAALGAACLVALLVVVQPVAVDDELAFGASVIEGLAAPVVEAAGLGPHDLSDGVPIAAMPEAPVARIRLLVLGDSQALRLTYPMAGATQTPFQLGLASFVGCGIGPGFPTSKGVPVARDWDGATCGSVISTWVDAIEQFQPDVVLVHVGAWEILDRRLGDHDVAFGTAEWDEATRQQLSDTTEILGASGVRLVWMAAPCFEPDGYDGGPPERSDPARSARWNELLRDVGLEKDVAVIAYDKYTCDGPASDNDLGGVKFREDGVHVTEEALPMVWAWLASQDAFADRD